VNEHEEDDSLSASLPFTASAMLHMLAFGQNTTDPAEGTIFLYIN